MSSEPHLLSRNSNFRHLFLFLHRALEHRCPHRAVNPRYLQRRNNQDAKLPFVHTVLIQLVSFTRRLHAKALSFPSLFPSPRLLLMSISLSKRSARCGSSNARNNDQFANPLSRLSFDSTRSPRRLRFSLLAPRNHIRQPASRLPLLHRLAPRHSRR